MALRSIEAEHKRRADWRAHELNAAADLTTFESVPHEEWAEKEESDEVGIAVSVMPLDTLQ